MRILLCALCALLIPSCVSDAQTESAKLRYEAIAPEYRAFVEAYPGFDAEQKARRLRTLQAWRLELTKGGSPPEEFGFVLLPPWGEAR